MKKIISSLLAIVIAAMLATSVSASPPAATGNALTGVNITILDAVTPAVSHGRRGDNSYFTAADGRVLGVMSATDARTVMNRVGVIDPGGNWLPPGSWPALTGMEWSHWFAAEFNRLRFGGSTQATVSVPQRFSPEWTQAEHQELIRLINRERERAGMHRLEVCYDLMAFAQIRAREGGRAGGQPHTRPNGDFVYNELWSGARTAQLAFDSWMNSPPHRGPMLGNGRWERVETFGVGVGEGGAIIILGEIRIRPA